jgi:uncharacterized protein YbjT (DUF2867 family)
MDDRAESLRSTGAEIVAGDLTLGRDVARALEGCRRMYFGMGVSSQYLQAVLTSAAAAHEYGELESFVNMSQMTVGQMDLTSTAESTQQRQQWLAEQVLNWSGLPVTHVRPTVFWENPLFRVFAFDSAVKEGTIRLPFGNGRTSAIAARDVADVVAAVLANPAPHVGRVYELTGPASLDMEEMATELGAALGRRVAYVDEPYDTWVEEFRRVGLPDHVFDHLATMARLHAQNRYDRMTRDVETILGRPAMSVGEFVTRNRALLGQASPSRPSRSS